MTGISRLYLHDPDPCIRQIASLGNCIGTMAVLQTSGPILRHIEITVVCPQGSLSFHPISSGCGEAMDLAVYCVACRYILNDGDQTPPRELGHAHPMHGEHIMDRV